MLIKSLSIFADRILYTLDVALRRKSRLGQFPWLRRIFLGPYRKLINLHGRGVLMNIGRCIPARMPPEYAWKVIEDYEPETVAALKNWMAAAQNPLLVDVGCSFGFITCAGLFSNPGARVIAIDSALQSLKAVQKICAYAPQANERLSLVWGFVSDDPTQTLDYKQANETTLKALNQPGISGRPETVKFICLDSATTDERSIPRHALDNLISAATLPETPILIKCDVEGAELLVLKSAKRLLIERGPALLLSVHPPALPNYGITKEDVRIFLADLGYSIKTIAIDHEEHWWCVKS